jgi:hypothetical protein
MDQEDIDGWLWFTVDVALVIVLALVLVYAISQWRKRSQSPAVKEVEREAIKDVYSKDTK